MKDDRPYQGIKDAVRSTGLSAYFLRQGVKDGSVPHIKSGAKILINVPRLLELLDEKSTQGAEVRAR